MRKGKVPDPVPVFTGIYFLNLLAYGTALFFGSCESRYTESGLRYPRFVKKTAIFFEWTFLVSTVGTVRTMEKFDQSFFRPVLKHPVSASFKASRLGRESSQRALFQRASFVFNIDGCCSLLYFWSESRKHTGTKKFTFDNIRISQGISVSDPHQDRWFVALLFNWIFWIVRLRRCSAVSSARTSWTSQWRCPAHTTSVWTASREASRSAPLFHPLS